MTLAQLAPNPVFKAFGNNGEPLVGGFLWTYAAGTSTPQASYPSSSESTPNTNPIVLNGRGECALWLDPTLSYKLNLTDSLGNQIPGYPVDNIVGLSQVLSGFITQTAVGAALWPPTEVEIANNVAPPVSLQHYEPGDWRRYGVVPGAGSGVDQSVALQNAINSGQPVVQMWGQSGDIYYSTTLTITNSLTFCGSGGEGNDASSGSLGPSTTRLFYTGAGVGIQVSATTTNGIANLHLQNFALWGTSAAAGGIDLGYNNGGTKLVLKSTLDNVQAFGFLKTGAYGFLLEGILETVFNNCYAYGCYDGFVFNGVVTTCTLRSCASRENVRYGYNFQSASSCSFDSRTFAESNGDAGFNADTSNVHFIDIFGYYSENNNTATGTAPLTIGTDGGAGGSPYNINFIGGVLTDPGVSGLYVNLDYASNVSIGLNIPSYSSGFAKQTANTLDCVILFQGLVWSIPSTNITGHTSGGLELSAALATTSETLIVPGGTTPVLKSSANVTSGAASGAGTLTNAPANGNPTKWIPFNDNGTVRYFPAW